MTHNGVGARKVPATYYWYFDGKNLTFQLWGEDLNWIREHEYNGQVYTLTNKVLPTPETEIESIPFPTGTFLLDSPSYYALEFDEAGNWYAYNSEGGSAAASGKYATTGNLYQELTHNYLDSPLVPATYYWDFDGTLLTFELWGEDLIPARKAAYDGQTYRKVD
jgi:hypothetical protein